MLSNYIEQLFKLDNYYDGLIVTDNKGYIEFFMTYRPDISGAKQEDLVGKHVLDIYPGLTEETSTIMRVLRSGEPIYNEYQTLITCREEVFQSVYMIDYTNGLPLYQKIRLMLSNWLTVVLIITRIINNR